MSLIQALRQFRYEIRKWTWHHLTAFFCTFFIYAFLHACRKAFSNVKDTMEKSMSADSSIFPYQIWQDEKTFEDPGDANVFLGELDFLFLIAYAIGLYISGYLGDRVNLRLMLFAGMFGSALLTFIFGYVSVVCNIRNKYFFRITYFFNGLFQSTGWPVCVAIVGNWFSKSSSGLVFGVWSSNASLGNIIGSLIVASVIDYGYEYGMLCNSFLLFCGSVIIALCLIPHPNVIGLPSADNIEVQSRRELQINLSELTDDDGELSYKEYNDEDIDYLIEGYEQRTMSDYKPITFFQACRIPGVTLYALSYACLKMVNYSFFFWLPTYLSQGLFWSEKLSDRLSNFYDIGGICGGIFAGVVSDFIGKRSPVVSSMLLLSMFSIYLYNVLGGKYVLNVILMTLTGFLIGGPANLICTAITADMGRHDELKGNARALSTVTGIIDGTGSVGAAIGQFLIGIVSRYGGWKWVFYFLIILQGFSFLLILPVLFRELELKGFKKKISYKELLRKDETL